MALIKKGRPISGTAKTVRAGRVKNNLSQACLYSKSSSCSNVNPSRGCVGAERVGVEAADYHMKYKVSETDLLQNLMENLCSSCRANLQRGYFERKMIMGNDYV